jgi:hypothetical protein
VVRATNNGSLGSSALVEYAVFSTISSLNTQDAFNLLLLGSGDAAGIARNALFDSTNTVVSCLNGFNSATTTGYMVEA